MLTDFHEMGAGSTYFFQPGVTSRRHPLIPQKNEKLTARIAEFHARALDGIGSLYFSGESFDDFYFGKGSTYPDAQGSIGILFEQASSRGHAQMNRFGRLTFPFTIRNQLTTSLSSHRAAVALREDLLRYQREFVENALDAAVADATKAWVFSSPESPRRARELAELLRRHRIEVRPLAKEIKHGGNVFSPGTSWIVVGRQPQYPLLKSMFEKRVRFNDATFYDVSTWNMPAAFDLDWAALDAAAFTGDLVGHGEGVTEQTGGLVHEPAGAGNVYAWAFSWSSMATAKLLVKVLDAGVRVLVAGEPLRSSLADGSGVRQFDRGSVLIPRGIQEKSPAVVRAVLDRTSRELGVKVFALATGLTTEGPDLGSSALGSMTPLRPLLIIGGGVSQYEAGELWYFLDHELGVPLTLVDADGFRRVRLGDYSHILAVSGSTTALDGRRDDVQAWLRRGGILVAQRSAATWAGRRLLNLNPDKESARGRSTGKAGKAVKATPISYARRRETWNRDSISGAVLKATLDRTHPLGWGIAHDEMPLWVRGNTTLKPARQPWNNPLRYTKSPLLSGHGGEKSLKKLSGQVAGCVDVVGSGVVVRFANNMSFRNIWRGTQRLYLNALFHARFTAGSGRALSDGPDLRRDD